MLLDHTTTPAKPPAPPAAAIRGFGPVRVATVESPAPPPDPEPIPLRAAVNRPAVWIAVAAAALIAWAFWPTLDWLVGKWSNDPSYSHGFLVPFVAGWMVYRKRKDITAWFGAPQPLLAAGLFAAIFALRGLAGALLFNQLDAFALLLTVAAAVLAVGGWRLVSNCWQGLVFLVFLVPLPYEWEQNVGGPLKVIATQASTFLLQTIGYPAVAEGNTILIDEIRLGVVDACSGLKMLVTFAAFGGGAILTLQRTWFEKFLIALAVVPIALLTNVLRITATGVIYTFVADKNAQHTIHDVAGWFMMPVGLAFLALELWVLNRLIVKPDSTPPISAPAAP